MSRTDCIIRLDETVPSTFTQIMQIFIYPPDKSVYLKNYFSFLNQSIGGFRNSQSVVIFAHGHIRGRQRLAQLYMESVLNVYILRKWAFTANVISKLVCIL